MVLASIDVLLTMMIVRRRIDEMFFILVYALASRKFELGTIPTAEIFIHTYTRR